MSNTLPKKKRVQILGMLAEESFSLRTISRHCEVSLNTVLRIRNLTNEAYQKYPNDNIKGGQNVDLLSDRIVEIELNSRKRSGPKKGSKYRPRNSKCGVQPSVSTATKETIERMKSLIKVLEIDIKRRDNIIGRKDQTIDELKERIQELEARSIRSCLGCENTFLSEGPNNRMCKKCKIG